MKETDWIDGKIKPVRVGVYKRRYEKCDFYCWWDGCEWGYGQSSPKVAKTVAKYRSPWQGLPWKGLAHDPD